MGRKKIENAKNQVISIRITTEEKTLLKNNPMLKKDIDKLVRNYIKVYL